MPLVAKVKYIFFFSTSICRLNLNSQQSQAYATTGCTDWWEIMVLPDSAPPPPSPYRSVPKCNGLVKRTGSGKLENLYVLLNWNLVVFSSGFICEILGGDRSGVGTICCHFTSWFRYNTATTTQHFHCVQHSASSV